MGDILEPQYTPAQLTLPPPPLQSLPLSSLCRLPKPRRERRQVGTTSSHFTIGRSSADIKSPTTVTRALVLWHRLAAFLLHKNPQERSALPLPGTIKPQIVVLVNALNAFLAHFDKGDGSSTSGQKQHLEGVIIECTKFGYSLFSHPCEWQFTLGSGSADRHTVMVVPGLEKLSNREGDVYDTPQVVVRPVLFYVAGIPS